MAPKNKKSNTNTPKIESVITEPVVVIQQAAEPIQVVQQAEPVVQTKQKGGKKKAPTTAAVDSEPVVINASQEAAPAPQSRQKSPSVRPQTARTP